MNISIYKLSFLIQQDLHCYLNKDVRYHSTGNSTPTTSYLNLHVFSQLLIPKKISNDFFCVVPH